MNLVDSLPAPSVDDVVEYRPIDGWNHEHTGAFCKVVAVRDTVVNHVKNPKPRVSRSRYLLTCQLPTGGYIAFYHIHAIPVSV